MRAGCARQLAALTGGRAAQSWSSQKAAIRRSISFGVDVLGVTELEARLEWVLESISAAQLAEATRDLPPPPPAASAPATRVRTTPRLPMRFHGPSRLLDLLVLLTAPVLTLTLLVAINAGTLVWPVWLWVLRASPIVVWALEPSISRS